MKKVTVALPDKKLSAEEMSQLIQTQDAVLETLNKLHPASEKIEVVRVKLASWVPEHGHTWLEVVFSHQGKKTEKSIVHNPRTVSPAWVEIWLETTLQEYIAELIGDKGKEVTDLNRLIASFSLFCAKNG